MNIDAKTLLNYPEKILKRIIKHRQDRMKRDTPITLRVSPPIRYNIIQREIDKTRSDMELIEEIKVGDKVKVWCQYGVLAGTIAEIKHNGWCDIDFGGGCMAYDVTPDRIERIIPISEEDIRKREEELDKEAQEWFRHTMSKEDAIKEINPEEHRIATPLQDLLAKEKWESYRRAVAGQIAVKLANVDNLPPEDVGRYAVETATMVVKHLREITI